MDHFLKYGNGDHNCCFNHKVISVVIKETSMGVQMFLKKKDFIPIAIKSI